VNAVAPAAARTQDPAVPDRIASEPRSDSTVAPDLGRLADTAIRHSRSRERHRRALVTAASAIGPKLLTLAILLIGARAVASAVTQDEFGVWLLLITASGLLGFADLGLGNGLLNEVAAANGRDDLGAARRAISSASAALLVLGVVLLGVFLVTLPVVPWSQFLDVRRSSGTAVTAAVGVFAAATALSIIFGAAPRVRLALQSGWVSNLWSAGGGIISLTAVVVAARLGASLPVLVGAALLGAPLVAAADSILLFGFQRSDLRPRREWIHRLEATRLVRHGAMFCFLAVAIAVRFESDVLVISHMLGAAAVPQFALPYRIMMLAPGAVSLVMIPLWPAFAEAIARGERYWAERTLKQSLALAIVGTTVVSALVVAIGPIVLAEVMGSAGAPSRELLLVLGLLACVMSASTVLGVFLSATGQLRIQVAAAAVAAPANLALSIALVGPLGVLGPAWGTIITQSLLVLLPVGLVVARTLGRSSEPAPA